MCVLARLARDLIFREAGLEGVFALEGRGIQELAFEFIRQHRVLDERMRLNFFFSS